MSNNAAHLNILIIHDVITAYGKKQAKIIIDTQKSCKTYSTG